MQPEYGYQTITCDILGFAIRIWVFYLHCACLYCISILLGTLRPPHPQE